MTFKSRIRDILIENENRFRNIELVEIKNIKKDIKELNEKHKELNKKYFDLLEIIVDTKK